MKDAPTLGDKLAADGTPDWDPSFKKTIHGVILVAGDSHLTVDAKLLEVTLILALTIKEITRIKGDVRPGPEDGHEQLSATILILVVHVSVLWQSLNI